MKPRANSKGKLRYGSKKLRDLYRLLRDERPANFNIRSATRCVIGQAQKLLELDLRADVYKALGLSRGEGEIIDYGWGACEPPPDLDHAVWMLRRAIHTGKLSWHP